MSCDIRPVQSTLTHEIYNRLIVIDKPDKPTEEDVNRTKGCAANGDVAKSQEMPSRKPADVKRDADPEFVRHVNLLCTRGLRAMLAGDVQALRGEWKDEVSALGALNDAGAAAAGGEGDGNSGSSPATRLRQRNRQQQAESAATTQSSAAGGWYEVSKHDYGWRDGLHLDHRRHEWFWSLCDMECGVPESWLVWRRDGGGTAEVAACGEAEVDV